MKLKTILQSVLVLLVAALVVAPLACHREIREAAQQYYCPMHPDYRSDKPGDCPICGMRLVPVEKKKEEKPAPVAAAPVERKILFYRNPMNPSVTSPVPTKDEMGMDYVPVYSDEYWQLKARRTELLASQEEFLRAREAAGRFAQSSLPEVRRGGEELLTAARRRLELFDVPASTIARLEKAGVAQRTVTLTAPVSGYVSGKQVFEGQQVQPGMDLLTVTDLSRVWVEADFYEYESRDLRLGGKAVISLPYAPGTRLAGRVAFVYPTVDPQTRTLKARLEFANPGLALKPGMYVDVTPDLGTRDGVVIPDSAVIDTGVRQMVFVQKGETFEPRQVRVGERADGLAVVLSGVMAGERVAVRANFLLDSESRLRAAIQALPAAPAGGGAP